MTTAPNLHQAVSVIECVLDPDSQSDHEQESQPESSTFQGLTFLSYFLISYHPQETCFHILYLHD